MERKKWWKNRSAFEIVSFILIIILFIAIIAQIGVILNLRSEIDEINKKQDQIENETPLQSTTFLYQSEFEKAIEGLN